MNRIVIHRLGEIVNKYRPAVPEFLEGSTRKTKKSVGQGQGKKKKKKRRCNGYSECLEKGSYSESNRGRLIMVKVIL